MTASHSSDFTWIIALFLTQSKTFQAKTLIVCFLAQEMKGVIVFSQEFPEGLTNVHLYYNLHHSKSCKCETSFKPSLRSLSSPHKNIPIIDIHWSSMISAITFVSSHTQQTSDVDFISEGKYYCQCSRKALPPALPKRGT